MPHRKIPANKIGPIIGKLADILLSPQQENNESKLAQEFISAYEKDKPIDEIKKLLDQFLNQWLETNIIND